MNLLRGSTITAVGPMAIPICLRILSDICEAARECFDGSKPTEPLTVCQKVRK